MIPPERLIRSVSDYRPQHDLGCKVSVCAQCSHTDTFHRDVLSVLDDPHKFEPCDCSCGLSAALDAARQQVTDEKTDARLAPASAIAPENLTNATATEVRLVREHTQHHEDHDETTFSLGRFAVVRRDWGKGEYSWAVIDDHGNGFSTPFDEMPVLRALLGSAPVLGSEAKEAK